MSVDAKTLTSLIEAELAAHGDVRVKAHIRDLLVEPTPSLRDWDYGEPGEQHICWTVLEDPRSNLAIAYCENGFGPRAPWGLLWMSGKHMSMGMDTNWAPTFLQAFFDSMIASR